MTPPICPSWRRAALPTDGASRPLSCWGPRASRWGPAFLSAHECSIHPTYKEKILKANDISTMTTGKRLGHPVRSLKTSFAWAYLKAEYDSPSPTRRWRPWAPGRCGWPWWRATSRTAASLAG